MIHFLWFYLFVLSNIVGIAGGILSLIACAAWFMVGLWPLGILTFLALLAVWIIYWGLGVQRLFDLWWDS